MNAYFWSDGDISLTIDNQKILDYASVDPDEYGEEKIEIHEPIEVKKTERIFDEDIPD